MMKQMPSTKHFFKKKKQKYQQKKRASSLINARRYAGFIERERSKSHLLSSIKALFSVYFRFFCTFHIVFFVVVICNGALQKQIVKWECERDVFWVFCFVFQVVYIYTVDCCWIIILKSIMVLFFFLVFWLLCCVCARVVMIFIKIL